MATSPTPKRVATAPASFLTHRGRKILLVDLVDCTAQEIVERIPAIRKVVDEQPLASLLVLTDVRGARFNSTTNDAMNRYSKANSPYVKRSAVVGATGLRRIVLQGVRLFTGRDIRSFDDRESALAWLVE
jgi:hypothetical protein